VPLAEPAQLRGVSEVLLDLCRLIFGGEGAFAEGDFERVAEQSPALKSGEETKSFRIDPPVVDGVVVAVDGEVDLRATHCWEPGSLGLLPLGDGVAHDVAGCGLTMDGQDEFVDWMAEVQQL